MWMPAAFFGEPPDIRSSQLRIWTSKTFPSVILRPVPSGPRSTPWMSRMTQFVMTAPEADMTTALYVLKSVAL